MDSQRGSPDASGIARSVIFGVCAAFEDHAHSQTPPAQRVMTTRGTAGRTYDRMPSVRQLDIPVKSAIVALWQQRCVPESDSGNHDEAACRPFSALGLRNCVSMPTLTTHHISIVVGPDFQVLVRIADLVVFAGEARPNQIAEAMAWARANREVLLRKWVELNERG